MQFLFSAVVTVLLSSQVLAHPTNYSTIAPTVQIKNGTVIGKHVDSYAQDHFLGIPFAQPPVGDLRFDMPKHVNQTWKKPLNATNYGPICFQYLLGLPLDPLDISYDQSEDCLTLNVVRPSGTTQQSKLPVLVYIYGGGFQEGGSADGRYNTSYMVKNSVNIGQPTIMVAMNYRLSGWGLLSGDTIQEQGLSNIALHDQRLALSWIQENIAAFGGDPSRVTLQGESAGAISIGYHLLANGGRDDGLFHAVICESGGPWFFGSYPSSVDLETTYQSVLTAVNCTDASNTLACLRATPFEDLNAIFAKSSFLPAVDGTIIPEYNSIALAKGNFIKVPLLIGTNTDEGKIFSGYGTNTTAETRAFMSSFSYINTKNNDTLDSLLELYPEIGSNSTHGQSDDTQNPPSPYGTQFTRVARYVGDTLFIAGRRYTCELWAQHGLPCYSYRFDTIPADTDPIALGATHFEEVAFVFNNVPGTGMDASAFAVDPPAREQNYQKLGDLMSRMWVSFAATHSPNHHQGSFFPIFYA